MLPYENLTKNLGKSLNDNEFQYFLKNYFSDLTEYNILKHNYICSEKAGIELGFTNNDAVYDDDEEIVLEEGNPIFSHFILYPKSSSLIMNLPYGLNFGDNRTEIIKLAGIPNETKEGNIAIFNKKFLVENYKVGELTITFDYDANSEKINSIQFRNNKLLENT
ncbi:hypothetical protein [Flavobacterium sp. 14A]|uniref:hypothetical protein n=1 Tax=Flavobacterium sp. 14A TaxID=2735896 RepID=UPI001570EF5C|nr:hypothetical protein [Flavobacterium sp. 14A]NRT13658.1 hypothetical protein [Flavobacterium sp. 14A]